MVSIQNEWVRIRAGDRDIEGMLGLPEDHLGVVLFVCGSGGGVKPPNDYLGSVLRAARLGTLWVNLMAPEEETDGNTPVDAAALAERLACVCDWLRDHPPTADAPILLFGVSHAAGAAFQLAAMRGADIAAIVTRAARPDLASHYVLDKICAPTLLIVGGLDESVIGINRAAYAALRCNKRFEIIPGATHLFEEPGSLEVVVRLARSWFLRHAHFALT